MKSKEFCILQKFLLLRLDTWYELYNLNHLLEKSFHSYQKAVTYECYPKLPSDFCSGCKHNYILSTTRYLCNVFYATQEIFPFCISVIAYEVITAIFFYITSGEMESKLAKRFTCHHSESLWCTLLWSHTLLFSNSFVKRAEGERRGREAGRGELQNVHWSHDAPIGLLECFHHNPPWFKDWSWLKWQKEVLLKTVHNLLLWTHMLGLQKSSLCFYL